MLKVSSCFMTPAVKTQTCLGVLLPSLWIGYREFEEEEWTYACTPAALSFVKACLRIDPADRPSATVLALHSYLDITDS